MARRHQFERSLHATQLVHCRAMTGYVYAIYPDHRMLDDGGRDLLKVEAGWSAPLVDVLLPLACIQGTRTPPKGGAARPVVAGKPVHRCTDTDSGIMGLRVNEDMGIWSSNQIIRPTLSVW